MKNGSFRRTAGSMKCLALCALALVASACSSDDSTSKSTGSVILPSDATQVVVSSDGSGFAPTPPAGSECRQGQASYALTLATRSFAWDECRTSSNGPYATVSGTRVLSQAEFDGFVATVRGVTASTRTDCGADKATIQLSVTTPAGEHDYLDDFYACNQAGTYVSGLDDVFQASSSLASSQ